MVIMRKMKEKCKDAARMRREKERVEFMELSKLLPLPISTTSQLDKASIIRLTSSYLRMRSAFPQGLGDYWGTKYNPSLFSNSTKSSEALSNELPLGQCPAISTDVCDNSAQLWNQIKELGSLLLQTLDGFVFALHRDGKIMYISETASVHLGLPQIDLTGSSIFDYVHPADHNDIMDLLDLTDSERAKLNELAAGLKDQYQSYRAEVEDAAELGRSFCMRMKCVLPKRNAGLVSNGYKAIHCTGYLKARSRRSPVDNQKQSRNIASNSQAPKQKVWDSYALVAVGHSLLSTASTEIKLDTKTFMFRASLDMRLHFIETIASNLLGFTQSDLAGQSLYQFIHVADVQNLELAHKQVLDKGQVVSKYYRLMRQDGGYIWVQTYATIINNPRSIPRPQHIVGICRVIGENQFDNSRVMLMAGLDGDSEQVTTSAAKKMSEQSSSQIEPPNSSIWINGQAASSKQASRQTGKSNRNIQKRVAAKLQHSNKTTRSYIFKRHKTTNTGLVSSSNIDMGPRSLRNLGLLRRTSDDSCSVVSSVASSSSSQSTPALSYASSLHATHSPLYHNTSTDSCYAYKLSGCYQQQSYDQLHMFDPTAPEHNNQYSIPLAPDQTNQYGPQHYWSTCGAQSNDRTTTFPISIDTSREANPICSMRTSTATVSPSLTASTVATSKASGDGSPVGGYVMSPERGYPSEQYYYKFDSQMGPSDRYDNDEYDTTYNYGTQVYSDHTRGIGRPIAMSYDDQFTQAIYYTSHQETNYLSGNSSA